MNDMTALSMQDLLNDGPRVKPLSGRYFNTVTPATSSSQTSASPSATPLHPLQRQKRPNNRAGLSIET